MLRRLSPLLPLLEQAKVAMMMMMSSPMLCVGPWQRPAGGLEEHQQKAGSEEEAAQLAMQSYCRITSMTEAQCVPCFLLQGLSSIPTHLKPGILMHATSSMPMQHTELHPCACCNVSCHFGFQQPLNDS